ncbi:hypothetical protein C8039_15480 [Halogeometricum sp. wsp3]|nr:hypothetical protein C8039_15480 [Halogeometricum sp. wsp3]
MRFVGLRLSPCRQGFEAGTERRSRSFEYLASAERRSDWYRVEPHDASDLCVHSERPVTLKGVAVRSFGGT